MRDKAPLTQSECQDPLVIRERFADIVDRYFIGDNPCAVTGAMDKFEWEVLKPLLRYVEMVEQGSTERRKWLDEVAAALLSKQGDGWTYVPDTLADEIRQMRMERDALRQDKKRLDEAERMLKVGGLFNHVCCDIEWSEDGQHRLGGINGSQGHNDYAMVSRTSIRAALDETFEAIRKGKR